MTKKTRMALAQLVCAAMGAVGMALALTIAHYKGVPIW